MVTIDFKRFIVYMIELIRMIELVQQVGAYVKGFIWCEIRTVEVLFFINFVENFIMSPQDRNWQMTGHSDDQPLRL